MKLNFRTFPHGSFSSANIEHLLSKLEEVGGCIVDNICIHTLLRLYEFYFSYFNYMFVFQISDRATCIFIKEMQGTANIE